MAPESMTLEQMDTLLSPPQSAVVDPIVNLDNLRKGKACYFTHEGQVKHGVIREFGYASDDMSRFHGPWIEMVSDGEQYTLWHIGHIVTNP